MPVTPLYPATAPRIFCPQLILAMPSVAALFKAPPPPPAIVACFAHDTQKHGCEIPPARFVISTAISSAHRTSRNRSHPQMFQSSPLHNRSSPGSVRNKSLHMKLERPGARIRPVTRQSHCTGFLFRLECKSEKNFRKDRLPSCMLSGSVLGNILSLEKCCEFPLGYAPCFRTSLAPSKLATAQPLVDLLHTELQPFGDLLRCQVNISNVFHKRLITLYSRVESRIIGCTTRH
jgi:hypothetical protein